MKRLVQYIVINKSLDMTVGKVAAQAVHASILANDDSDKKLLNEWYAAECQRIVIVLQADSTDQLRNLGDYLDEYQIPCAYVIDEGVNEIPTMSLTAVATGILDKDKMEELGIFDGFKLYSKTISNWWSGAKRV